MHIATKNYRPDIDGLRAIAVLSILLFHLDCQYISGGFVGVDVFFVISGFLITKIIKEELEATNQFRFSSFYLRRARRLLPALLFTLSLSFVTAFFLFAPEDLERFGGALIYSIISLSNFYFWGESGYFDSEASIKPLLHTWSLSVEEQFYLCWPLALFLLIKNRSKYLAPIALLVGGLFSLYLNDIFVDDNILSTTQLSTSITNLFDDGHSTIFFLAPFRAFEFVIGAVLVWLERCKPTHCLLSDVLFLSGIAIIVYALLIFTRDSVFPSYNALLPCLGAALIIFSNSTGFSGRILNNKIMVGIGLISYSIYLIHWPLIVFWKYYTLRSLEVVDQLGLSVTSIALAYLMYRTIEKPFQVQKGHEASSAPFGYVCVSLAALLTMLAIHTWTHNGWAWRFPSELYQTVEEITAKRNEYWGDWKVGIADVKDFAPNKMSVLVVGDSLAIDVANMLREKESLEVHYSGTSYLCRTFTLAWESSNKNQARLCAKNKGKFDRVYETVDVIVLGDQFSTWVEGEEIINNVNLLRGNGFKGPIVIYGERPVYQESVYRIVLKHGRPVSADKYASKYLRYSTSTMRENVHKSTIFYESHQVHYFSPVAQLCKYNTWCDVLTPDNKLIYFDAKHFTFDGTQYLADEFMHYLFSLKTQFTHTGT